MFRCFSCFSQDVKTQINEEDQSVANNVFIAEVARIYLHVFKKRPPYNNSTTIKMLQNIRQNKDKMEEKIKLFGLRNFERNIVFVEGF